MKSKYPLVLTARDHLIIRDLLASEGYVYEIPTWAEWAESMMKTFEKVK